MKRFLLIIFIIITAYILMLKIPRNYELDYVKNKVKINEKYDKTSKIYRFVLTYNEIDYPINIKSKYTSRRKLIKNIKIKEEDKETCLTLSIKENNKIICSKNGELIDSRLISFNKKTKKEIIKKTYEKIKIYNEKYNYYIWSYNGFININKKNEKIKIFNKEKYSNTSTYQSKDCLIIPDYDNSYYFKKIYLLDTSTNKIKNIDFDYEISYNILYLGEYKNKVYMLDLKNKNEFEINLSQNKITLLNEKNNTGLFYNGKKLEKIEVNTLVKEKEIFPNEYEYSYKLENEYIYEIIDNYQIRISDKKIKCIVTQKDDEIYYISENKLYRYNHTNGEELLLEYEELIFNYKNQIYIFNK